MKRGTLFGVSVGPGDPELLTMKAIKTICACPIIATPVTNGKNTLALDILKSAVDISQKEIIFIDFLMTQNAADLEKNHKKSAQCLVDYLKKGKDIAFLNLGDTSIFGSFHYIGNIVRDKGFSISVIPGVTSFSAVAAKLNTTLTNTSLPLHIIPASYKNLSESISLSGTKVIMKSGKQLSSVLKLLKEKKMLDRTSIVSNCGLKNEKVLTTVNANDNINSYFTTLIIK